MLFEDGLHDLATEDDKSAVMLLGDVSEDLTESLADSEMVEWVNCDAHSRVADHSPEAEVIETESDW